MCPMGRPDPMLRMPQSRLSHTITSLSRAWELSDLLAGGSWEPRYRLGCGPTRKEEQGHMPSEFPDALWDWLNAVWYNDLTCGRVYYGKDTQFKNDSWPLPCHPVHLPSTWHSPLLQGTFCLSSECSLAIPQIHLLQASDCWKLPAGSHGLP